jgi:glyoxylase-like metal-dependent hydrolase (beta-lactamase superfamily II)
MHEDDYFWLNPPEYMLAWISGKFERFNPDEAVHEGDEILLGGISFKAIHTPGHSRGGICLYCKENNVIFSGDTIFQESIGRTDLTGGSKNTLLKSISEKILILPDETEIYPGHGDKTKLINEKKYNPFLQKIGVNDEISD